jgi:acyl carrier protein
MDNIEALTQLIQRQFGIEGASIDPDAPFADYDLDSLTLAELLFAIEDEFHVEVPDQAVASLATLRDLAQLLDQLTAAKEA